MVVKNIDNKFGEKQKKFRFGKKFRFEKMFGFWKIFWNWKMLRF
jgi:hypothetical protein